MTKARCFNCGVELPIAKPLEELIKIRLPIFCTESSLKFPNNGTPEFNAIFHEISQKYLQKAKSK